MRVLLAGQTYGPRNGPGVFTRNLARGLVVSGHEVTVAVPAGQLRSSERNDAGVRVCEVRGVTLAPLYPDVMVSLGSIRAAERILRERRPDLVHVQDHYPLSRAFVRAASIPIVATNHFVPENITAQTWFGRVGPLRRAFDRFSWKLVKDVLNAAAIVTSPTATAAAILTRHGVSPQVRVISCGVDTKRFTPRPEHHDGIVAIYVGRLDRDKDVETLVEAIWRCDGVRLVIAGRGRQERHLRKSDRVIFKGFVADEELPQLLRSADFFAIAGRAELQSIATLEAMACGLGARHSRSQRRAVSTRRRCRRRARDRTTHRSQRVLGSDVACQPRDRRASRPLKHCASVREALCRGVVRRRARQDWSARPIRCRCPSTSDESRSPKCRAAGAR
ncbi:MAG: glucosyl transferase [Acidobacteria bacterium]|nr:MAG: glucosyl transferase [Acidobacteriota bacterium]